MKKIISILACVCLLLSVMIVPISAAETSATITFDDSSKAEWSTTQQLWQENGITVTNNKAGSTTNIDTSKKYSNPARFYKGSEVIVEYPGMTKLVIDHTGIASKYVGWADSFSDSNATAVSDSNTTTITFATPVDSFTFNSMSVQSRAYSITAYAEAAAGGDTCAHEETTATSNGDETHTVVCDSCGETISTAAECVDSDKDGACDTCTGAVELPFDPTGKTPAEIVDAAYALEAGETIENVTLTGVVASIGTAYNSSYKNVSLTIAVNDTDKTMYCYRLTADEDLLETLAGVTVEDTITVTGTIGVYNGAPQFQAGAKMTACEKGDLVVVVPDDPKVIVDEAFALEAGSSLLYEATLQGKVVAINEAYSESYGNITLTIEVEGTTETKELLCYRLKAGEGADASTVKLNDVIAVTGTIKNYNGTIEFDNGCTFVMVEEYVEETFEGTDPENPIQLAVNESVPATITEIKVPAEGTVFVQAADANGIFHVTSADGTYMLINGMANQATADAEYDLTLCGYEMVNIYNPGTETITLYVFLEAGAGEAAGTWENPEVLELMENPWMPSFPPSAQAQTELAAGNQGYFYKITATEDGAFIINVSAYDAEYNSVGYQLSVTNNTTSWQSDFIARAADAEDYYDQLIVPVKAGDELLINAGTFDAADVWNAPAGTLNVQINFAAVGSYDNPVVLEETGSNSATVEAGSQGYYYEWIVEADGTVTITMDDEAGWQYNISKVPVDEDDYANYYNSDTHYYNDETVIASETVDVVAGETIKVWVNTYDAADEWNPPAGTVNWTLAWSEKVEEPVNPGKITVSDADAQIGKEFTVTIDISENPGIIGATLGVIYDANVLELISAEAGVFTNTSNEDGDVVLSNYNFGPIENNPFMITWIDPLATENITTNGTLVTLTFKVKADAAVGTTEVSITFADDDIYDVNLDNVAFEATAGTVTITEDAGLPGDANGDGVVNARDAVLIMQYANGWTVTIDLDNADVNGDGTVNARDYTLLTQYNNGWPVELK